MNTLSSENLAKEIRAQAIQCGYEDCGIIPVTDLDGYQDRLQKRKQEVPESVPFYAFADMFSAIKQQHPWAKSVLICIDWYGDYKYPERLQGKYAKDYLLSCDGTLDIATHQNRLGLEKWLTQQGIRWAGGEENSPAGLLPLRYAAVAAGLGIIRKNNFFYTEKGSRYRLKGYLIDCDCTLKQARQVRACPEKCSLCQKACLTDALSAPFTMNPMKCVSFLTTFGGGTVPDGLQAAQFSNWLCGCDACQDACPYNYHDWSQGMDFPGLSDLVELLQPENLCTASDGALIEKVIPLTDSHILPQNVETLRNNARRVLRK